MRPDTVAVAVVLADWAWPFTHATGGRSAGVVAAGLALLAVALVVVRPWQLLRARWTALAGSLSAAALGVCALAPGGWSGSDVAASYVLAAGTGLLVAGWVRRDADRRTVGVAGVLIAAGLEQSLRGLNTWIAGQTPSAAPVGTFYWHNPFAAFLLPTCIVAATAAIWRIRPLAVLGWITAPVAGAAIVLSGSRASLGALAIGWAGLGAASIVHRDGRGVRALRWAISGIVCAAASLVLPGPPFFSTWHSALGAAETRSANGETVGTNAGYRVQFWHEAWSVFTRHQVAGAGYDRLGTASVGITPPGWAHTPYAHNGFLQVLCDGGLLLAVPFLLATGLALLAGVRRVLDFLAEARTAGEAGPPAATIRMGAGLALLAALAHSAVDNDWSYPSLLVQATLLFAVAASGRPVESRTSPVRSVGPGFVIVLGIVALVPVVAAAGLALAQRSTDRAIGSAVGLPGTAGIRALEHAGDRAFAGDKPWRILLTRALPTGPNGPLQAPIGAVQEAVDGTARSAAVDPVLALRRAWAEALLGDVSSARATLRNLAPVIRGSRPLAANAVPVLVALGATDDARRLAVVTVKAALSANAPDLWRDVALLGGVPDSTPQYACAGVLAAARQPIVAGVAAPPTPPLGNDCTSILDISTRVGSEATS